MCETQPERRTRPEITVKVWMGSDGLIHLTNEKEKLHVHVGRRQTVQNERLQAIIDAAKP